MEPYKHADKPQIRPRLFRGQMARLCKRKRRHGSQGAAEAHIRSLLKRDLVEEGEMESYYCTPCRSWHVGHKFGSREQEA